MEEEGNNHSAPECGFMSDSDLQLWSSCQYWCEGVFFSAVGSVGLLGNLISIAVLATRDMKKHSFNHLLIALACFDVLFILTGVPVHVAPIFKLESRLYSVLYPHFLYPLTSISFTGGIYMTLAITIERYIAVCRPHQYRMSNARMSTFSKVIIYTIPVAVFSLLINIPKFLETQVTYDDETGIQYNVTQLRLNPTYIWWYTLSYICHPTITTAIGPIISLLFLNFKIFKGIRRARTQVHSSHSHGEMNLAAVLVTICLVFLACHVLRVYLAFQAIVMVDTTVICMSTVGYWIPPSWLLCLESVSHLLVMISSSSNFLIYCTISTKFKIFIKRTFLYRDAPHPDSLTLHSIQMQTMHSKSTNRRVLVAEDDRENPVEPGLSRCKLNGQAVCAATDRTVADIILHAAQVALPDPSSH